MPYIIVNGQKQFITDAEYAALTSPASGTTAPITGTDLQIATEQPIVIPNTSNPAPDQPLTQVAENKASYPLLTNEETEAAAADPANNTPVDSNEDPFEAARLAAQDRFDQEPPEIDPQDIGDEDPFEAARLEREQELNRQALQDENWQPEPVGNDDPSVNQHGLPYDDDGNLNPGWTLDENGNPVWVGGGFVEPATQASADASRAAAANVRKQAELQRQLQQAAQADWRVKLSLAPQSNYLYNDPELQKDGILYPLSITSGVIFPYMPTISTSYSATYNSYDLTHSNYRGYFYQGSHVNEVSVNATFTAQDTQEANYLLAVIHFFRSITKMFYGQDAVNRGAPPPLVFLTGLGEYQFAKHPCVVTNFEYSLPNDVDYIRARVTSINGTNLLSKRDRQTIPTNPISSALSRLSQIGQPKGGINIPPAPPTLGQTSPTYVPTRLDMTLSLLPMQTRDQVSKQFSLQKFANGNLLKGGFW